MCLEGFPIFDGVAGELRPWISWLEDFFVQEDFTADEKLNLAQSLLEGEALLWFQRRTRVWGYFDSWGMMELALVLRFGDRDERIRLFQELREEKQIEILEQKKESKKEVDLCLGKITSQPSDVTQSHDALNWNCNMNTGVTLISPRFIDYDSEKLQNDDLREVEASSVLVNLDNVVKNVNHEKKKAIHNRESNQLESIPQVSHQLVELSHLQVSISTLEPSRSVHQLGFSGMDSALANRKLGEKHVENPIFEALNEVAWIFTEESPKSQEVDVMLKNTDLSLFFDGNVAAQLQIVYGSEMDPYGYQVFDQMFLRGYNLLQHKKMSKFPKSWMFKFKNSLEAQNSAPEQLLFLDIVADAKGTRDGLQGLSISDIVLLQQITYKMRIETVAVAGMLYRMEQRVDSTFAKVNLSILAQLIFGETDVKHKWKSKELQAVLIIDKNSRGSDVTYGTCSAATVDKRGYFSLWHRWRDKGQNKEHGLVIVYKFQIEQQIDVWWSQIGQVIQPATFASMLLTLSITPTNPQQPVYMMIKHDSIIQRALEQIQRAVQDYGGENFARNGGFKFKIQTSETF